MLGTLWKLRNLTIMAYAELRNGGARVLRFLADFVEHRHKQ